MSRFDSFDIIVPASTANLGPGFDSVGMALNRHLSLTITPSEVWEVELIAGDLEGIPTDESNFIIEIAKWLADKWNEPLPPVHIGMVSNIPLARGFGSSATAIVAGIELTNQLLHLHLTDEEKVQWATLYEGHPDNVAPSIYGGLVVGHHDEEGTEIVRAGIPAIDLVALIPDYPVSTSKSRDALPETLNYAEAVKASSISNVQVAAMMRNDWTLAGRMMKKDRFHRPYRYLNIPEWKQAEEIADQLPVYGATLSGAGPIILFFTPQGTGEEMKSRIQRAFPESTIECLQPDPHGVTVKHKLTTE
ncbi:homoserine kinase [Salisediminibacterium beveridgei]|uniref:Homoserine kinase n=1 Tax=Salisediminibacterium beveridgei TaxID=632773 RepID=A0A1D7QR30_9BACI|nr:homoserine kinase [Salisediminibacterium beveridgei]AOM81472.1 Homoserine kinase [Salisediminibacterium beveridgei]